MSTLTLRSKSNPMDDALLLGGGILLAFGFLAFLQVRFLTGLDVSFTETERMLLLLVGAALLALEQKTEKKIQEYALTVAGAFGVVVGIANLLYHFELAGDVLNVVNKVSPFNGLLYFTLGVWAITAAVISEAKHK